MLSYLDNEPPKSNFASIIRAFERKGSAPNREDDLTVKRESFICCSFPRCQNYTRGLQEIEMITSPCSKGHLL